MNLLTQCASVCIYLEIPHWFTDYDSVLEEDGVPVTTIALKVSQVSPLVASISNQYRTLRLKMHTPSCRWPCSLITVPSFSKENLAVGDATLALSLEETFTKD